MVAIEYAPDPLPSIVLLVDDQPNTVAAYSAGFEASGLWVATARNPIEALSAVEELKPDLVITACFGAADAAVNLLETLKGRPDTQRIPVVLIHDVPVGDVPPHIARLADLCVERAIGVATLVERARALISAAQTARRAMAAAPAAERASRPAAVVTTQVKANEQRRCPGCGSVLEWTERSRLCGIEYDYYRWCGSGCGLYCYDRDAGRWVKLA